MKYLTTLIFVPIWNALNEGSTASTVPWTTWGGANSNYLTNILQHGWNWYRVRDFQTRHDGNHGSRIPHAEWGTQGYQENPPTNGRYLPVLFFPRPRNETKKCYVLRYNKHLGKNVPNPDVCSCFFITFNLGYWKIVLNFIPNGVWKSLKS